MASHLKLSLQSLFLQGCGGGGDVKLQKKEKNKVNNFFCKKKLSDRELVSLFFQTLSANNEFSFRKIITLKKNLFDKTIIKL